MFRAGSIDDFPEPPPPPVPPRNPLRNDPHRLEKQDLRPRKKGSSAVASSGQPTLQIIAESSRERVDTAFTPASPRHANREATLDESSVRPRPRPQLDRALHRLSFLSDDEESASMVSRRSSWTNGLKRFSSALDRCSPSTVRSLGSTSKRQRDIEEAMANLQSKLDDADADDESLATISSYDGASRHENIARNEEESRIEAWLQRGTIDAQLPESACTSQTVSTAKSPSAKSPSALNIFPPTSPKTGKREYICPPSPMNNGRDVYGNYIPTNTQDYMTSQRIPSSPKLQPDVEDTRSCGQSSTAHLRGGGGGWWNSLGIGLDEKKPPETKQAELAGSEAIRKRTPAQSLRMKRRSVGPSQYSASVHSVGGGSYVGRSRVGEMANLMSPQQMRPSQFDYHNGLEDVRDQRLSDHSFRMHSTPQHPSSRTHTNNDHVQTSPRQHPRPLYDETMSQASFTHPPLTKTFSAGSKKAESPWFGVSYTPRTNKKWNQGPASGPPSSVAMPPPPSFLHTTTGSEVASSVGVLSPSKHRYEHQPSLAESYDDQAWELQSLQLGESVSVAGGPRRTVGGVSRRNTAPLDPEEFEAAQKIAQVEFRPLCQDIMARSNAEISRVERAWKEGLVTPEQYKYQMDWHIGNKDQALKHSAESTGYVILTSEFAILESLSTPDAYAIYHSLLSTTNPTLWQSLVQQHLMAQTMQIPSVAQRTSSLDQVRHIAGKMARFVLAAPSDPELKTYSGRKAKGAEFGSEGDEDEEWMRRVDEKGKGKEKAKISMPPPETATHDFAIPSAPTQSRITATTAVNTNTHLTGTTAVSSSSRLFQAKIQQAYPPIKTFPGSRDPPSRTGSQLAATEASQQSMWPEGDSEGNWWVRKGNKSLRLRGGKGTEKKEKGKKRKAWLEGWKAEAMYLNGSLGG